MALAARRRWELPLRHFGSRAMAWSGCHWLEKDIVEMRHLIAKRREAYIDGKRRFNRGGNFTTEPLVFARRQFGKERDAMRLEEAKIKQLEVRLDGMIEKHRKRCR
mmetsp:Transcript_52493/g.125434  ORF Transcript_52493/g.125434 Transcript_52493/m.125434 type:complete len:106 (+) Transcript_52493:115-432(+)